MEDAIFNYAWLDEGRGIDKVEGRNLMQYYGVLSWARILEWHQKKKFYDLNQMNILLWKKISSLRQPR